MPVVDIYATLTNVVNKLSRERDMYVSLERAETTGQVQAGDEQVNIPAAQLNQLKTRLTTVRTKTAQLANAVGAEIVYREVA